MRSNGFKKFLSLILIAAMVMSLAACSKSGDDEGKDTQPTSTEKVTGTEENKATGTESNDNKEPEVTESPAQVESEKTLADFAKVSAFKYYGIASGITDEEFNALSTTALVKEQTGYDVTYFQAPADAVDGQTAITNIFMLKQDYQAVKVSKDQFYTLLALDALKPITQFVQASTVLKEQISDFGWSTASKDGEIYAIPQKNAIASTSVGICYRLDWLQEYNTANPDKAIPVPSEENGYSMTVSDYKAMLEYFATKVPEGGYAMAVDTNGVFLESILPAFGIYQDWADVNGTLTYIVEQPGFQAYADYMQDLYDSGLIQYQATSNDAGAVKSLQARTVGAGRVAHWNAYAIETTNAPEGTELSTYTDAGIGYISALIPDANRGDASAVRVFAAEGYSYYTVIPNFATDEQAAAVVDWAEKKLDKDFFLKLVLGTEGETFTIDNGNYYPILPAFNDNQGYADKFLDGLREADYAQYWMCRVRKTSAQNKMFSQSNYNILSTGIQNPVAVMPPCEDYDTYYNAANSEVKNFLVTSMYEKSASVNAADAVAKFNEFEGEAIKSGVNAWYQAWSAKDTFNNVKPR